MYKEFAEKDVPVAITNKAKYRFLWKDIGRWYMERKLFDLNNVLKITAKDSDAAVNLLQPGQKLN